MEDEKLMRIGDLEKKSGVPRHTIHYYLREGLLRQPVRPNPTTAYYNQSHLKRLEEIQKIKRGRRIPISFLKEALGEMRLKKTSDSRSEDVVFDPKEKRRQEIIEAAVHLFSHKGFHSTNIKDITKAAGISTGAFYTYYKDKNELFIEVVDDVIRSLISDVSNAIRKEKDYIKRIELRARVFINNYKRYSEILNQLRGVFLDHGSWPREKVKEIYMNLTEPLSREMGKALENGLVRDVDPDMMAFAMMGLVDILTFRMTLDDKYNEDQIIEFMFSLLSFGAMPTHLHDSARGIFKKNK